MTALVLSQDFTDQAIVAARQLHASGENVVEMQESKGHFVCANNIPLPVGGVQIAVIQVDGRDFSVFTIV